LMSTDVRIDKVTLFSRFMVLHPNGIVVQMYCVLRVLDSVVEICQPQIAKLRTYFRLRPSVRLAARPFPQGEPSAKAKVDALHLRPLAPIISLNHFFCYFVTFSGTRTNYL
jgi:hypothetical protein